MPANLLPLRKRSAILHRAFEIALIYCVNRYFLMFGGSHRNQSGHSQSALHCLLMNAVASRSAFHNAISDMNGFLTLRPWHRYTHKIRFLQAHKILMKNCSVTADKEAVRASSLRTASSIIYSSLPCSSKVISAALICRTERRCCHCQSSTSQAC